ncbi:MAG: polyprenyl diphosphate synthase [bacterium]
MGIWGWLKALRGRSREDAPDRTEAGPGGRIPFHVAIIMDGNGRWARRRRLPVLAGHRAGSQAVRRVVEAARDAGIRQLTLYSFSTENWTRPADEVEGLMRLHGEMIDSEVPTLHANDCRVVFVGRRDGFSEALLAKMEWAEALTARNGRMVLFIAFNYGGRREIVDAVHRAVAAGVDPALITEDDITANMYSSLMHEPDLLIRTSGERRLSNFLLWQSAYSELFFSARLWPDFDEGELWRALKDYAGRERRFGARGEGDHA